MHRSRSRCLLAAWLLISNFPLKAEVRPAPPMRLPLNLGQLTQRAGMNFSGKVTSVKPERSAASEEVTSVAITFRVEQAIRGTRVGQQLTIHEWAGLWATSERYRVGERLILFLHVPSKLGLTSPVGGAAGRFRVDQGGRVLLDPIQLQNLKGGPVPIRIDPKHRILLPEFKRAIQRLLPPAGGLHRALEAEITASAGANAAL
jgi:hypothetical protein